ncbi:MAG: permease prefix domain 1-containing protein [Nocardioidaceae bacterium]
MNTDQDLVERYLDDLTSRLRGSASHVRRVVAESEAHLRDAVEANLAAGMDVEDAEGAALRSFGTAAQVAVAVNRADWSTARGPVLWAGAGVLLRLAAAGMVVIGVSAGAARLVAALTSTQTIFGLPSGVRMPAASCAHWLAVQPGATSCQQAATLEASGDLTLSLGLIGVLGVLLVGLIALLHRLSPERAPVLPPVLGPAIGAAVFGAAATGLAALAGSDAVLYAAWGSGLWWTMSVCSLGAALVAARLLVRAIASTYRSVQRPAETA